MVKNAYARINRTPLKYMPLMVLVSLTINLLSLALPLAMKQIYGKIIPNKSLETLTFIMIGCGVALIIEATLRRIKESSGKWLSAKYESRLSTHIVKKVLNSYDEESNKTGYNSKMDTINSISRVTSYYSTGFFQLFVDLPFMLLFLWLIYYMGGALVLAPVTLALIYIVIMLINAQIFFKSRKDQIDANNNVLSSLIESLEKIHLVKAAGLESFRISKYKKELDKGVALSFLTNKNQMLSTLIGPYFSQLTLFAVLIGGGILMNVGLITFGEITACAILGGRAIAPIQSMMSLYMQSKDIRVLKRKLDAIDALPEQYPEDVPNFPENISGSVEVIDLEYKNIQTNEEQTISFNASPGTFVCFDPTKFLSYKEVFGKLIGKTPITKGTVLIDNLDICRWNMTGLRGKIEYLSDNVSIYKGTVLENITLFDPACNHDAYESAALTGLEDLVANMTEGFESKLDGQAVNYLSTTFIQRLSLSRALLGRPVILVIERIDESMDNYTLEVFLWLLGNFKGSMTIIIAADNPKIMEMADCIIN